jgi:hypothetical protein
MAGKNFTFAAVILLGLLAFGQEDTQGTAAAGTATFTTGIGGSSGSGSWDAEMTWGSLYSGAAYGATGALISSSAPDSLGDSNPSSNGGGNPGFVETLALGTSWAINGATGPLQKLIYGPGYRALSPSAQQAWDKFSPQLGMMPIAGVDVPAFGANDLIMGLKGELPVFQARVGKGGGNTILNLIERDLAEGNIDRFYDDAGKMRTGFPLMKQYMDDLKPGAMMHFTLDSLERNETGGITVFDASSRYYTRITPQELRYIRSEWGGRFGDHNVSFYSWGAKVPKPW